MNNVNSHSLLRDQPVPGSLLRRQPIPAGFVENDSQNEEVKLTKEKIIKIAKMMGVIGTVGAVLGGLAGIPNGEVIAGIVKGAFGGSFWGAMVAAPQPKGGISGVALAAIVTFVAAFRF